MTEVTFWKDQVADKRARQKAAIPKEWLITPVPEDKLNVIDVPETCGLLTQRELDITRSSDVVVLLDKLANAEWSAVEVTVAFYKRATIAHQLVRFVRMLCALFLADDMTYRSTASQRSSLTRLFSWPQN